MINYAGIKVRPIRMTILLTHCQQQSWTDMANVGRWGQPRLAKTRSDVLPWTGLDRQSLLKIGRSKTVRFVHSYAGYEVSRSQYLLYGLEQLEHRN
jgi:hypothetical protein